MSDEIVKRIHESQMRDDIPDFRAGDTLEVHLRVREREKERIQVYKGVCIARKNAGLASTFTVRKISSGVAVERVFPVHSPMIKEIRHIQRGRVRRAKLHFLRGRYGKKAKLREVRPR